MRKLLCSTLALTMACIASHAEAQVFVQPAATGPLASPGSVTYNFNAGAGPGLAVFDINGFASLDGDNFYTDIFTLLLNATPIYQATFDLGGGGTNTVFFKPVGATETAFSGPGDFDGGIANLSVPLLSLVNGNNTLTFSYDSPGSPYAGPQGLGDEGWGISNLVVTGAAFNSAVPEPATWALLLIGFGLAGAAMRTTGRKQRLRVSYS